MKKKAFKTGLLFKAYAKGLVYSFCDVCRKKPYIGGDYVLKLKENDVVISNSLRMSDGSYVFSSGDTVWRRCEDAIVPLLKVDSASEWRLMFQDSSGNVYVSPHSSVSGSMNVCDRGLYRMESGSSSFSKVIELFNPESEYLKEIENNDDTVWTMCEDDSGGLYAGVYAHTLRSNPAIYKSFDGGKTWRVVYNFLSDYHKARHIHSIAYDKYQKCLYCLVGELNTMFKSEDGGATWQDLELKTGSLFSQKCTVVLPTEKGRILGSDGKYNCELYFTGDDKTYKTVYRGWAGTVFGLRKSDLTGYVYAFTKIDASVTSPDVMPPVSSVRDVKAAYSWLRCNVKERAEWLTYHVACRRKFRDDSVRPQSSAILMSQDGGKTWSVVFRAETGSEDNYGFWTAGTFVEGECDFCLVAKNSDGSKNFVKTINVKEVVKS